MEELDIDKKCFLCLTELKNEDGMGETKKCNLCPPGSKPIHSCCEEHLSVHRSRQTRKQKCTESKPVADTNDENNKCSSTNIANGVPTESDSNIICWPFYIDTLPSVGRIMIASRDIRAGEIILEEMPAIWGPNNKSAAMCLGCLKPTWKSVEKRDVVENDEVVNTTLRTCSKCKFPVCGTECKLEFLYLIIP